MIYREVGQFKASYAADRAIFPIRQDRWLMLAALAAAYLVIPAVGSEYWLLTIMIPFLVFALAALGLNLLTGYAGQVSLGTGGFMAVGAFATYKLTTAFPGLNIVLALIIAGIITALVGVLFGFPSLRIKGFYLAVATLASQFFLIWLFNKFPWFYNYSASGVISAPPRAVFGRLYVSGAEADPRAKYLFVLTVVILLALAAKGLVRGRIGRSWVRDMDIAAEIIGIRPLAGSALCALRDAAGACPRQRPGGGSSGRGNFPHAIASLASSRRAPAGPSRRTHNASAADISAPPRFLHQLTELRNLAAEPARA